MDSPLKMQSRCVALFPNAHSFAIGSIEGRVAIQYLSEPDMPYVTVSLCFVYLHWFRCFFLSFFVVAFRFSFLCVFVCVAVQYFSVPSFLSVSLFFLFFVSHFLSDLSHSLLLYPFLAVCKLSDSSHR